MDRDSLSILSDWCLIAELELVLGVVPDHDVTVGAGDNELLAKACVHTIDRLIVERTVDILAPR